MGHCPVPIYVSRGNFPPRYEVPKFLPKSKKKKVKFARGEDEPLIGSKEIKQAYSTCFGEEGLFHRYRPDLYKDILRCKRQLSPKESEQSQQEDLCTDSVHKLRKRHSRRSLKATPIVINGQVVSDDAIWHTEDEAALVIADQVEGIACHRP